MNRSLHLITAIMLPVLLRIPAAAGTASTAPAADTRVERDVLYGPTPYAVVDRMLAMAEVGKDDYLIDLGSGDGRIVIRAAEKHGTRGLGIDIDPRWIPISTDRAEKAGVGDRTRFVRQDLFKADLGEATVVTMFLNPETNLRVRPKLLRELEPGTRVVSHKYDMPGWAPDSEAAVGGRRVYLWVVPANVSGDWTGITSEGTVGRLELRQRYQMVEGTLTAGGRTMRVQGKVSDGDSLTFTVDGTGNGVSGFEGTVRGDRLEGVVAGPRGKRRWSARRTPGTMTSVSGE